MSIRIGTKNNVERSGKRDLEISRLMRLPNMASEGCSGLRSLDLDPTLWCNDCSLPVFLQETTQRMLPKSCRYVIATAKALNAPAFLIRHGKELGTKIFVQQVYPVKSDPQLYSEKEFAEWGERMYRWHKNKRCKPTEEKNEDQQLQSKSSSTPR